MTAVTRWGDDLVRELGRRGILPTFVPLKATATPIAARIGTAPGTGSAYIVRFDGTNLSDTTETVTVRNLYGGQFVAGKYLWALRWQGLYWAITQEC
jgi:hypothetical protein